MSPVGKVSELRLTEPAGSVTVPVAVRFVNAPVEAVVAPIGVLLIEPPEIVAPVTVALVSVAVGSVNPLGSEVDHVGTSPPVPEVTSTELATGA